MLKTDISFLEREIKARKQSFGVRIYDLMVELESNSDLSDTEKEKQIRFAFDDARKDIAVIQAKIDCKNEEINAMAPVDATKPTAQNSGSNPSGAETTSTPTIPEATNPSDTVDPTAPE